MSSQLLSTTAIVFGALAISLASAGEHGWSYHGHNSPSHWKDSFPECGGRRQSPLDLRTFVSAGRGPQRFRSRLTPLVFKGWEETEGVDSQLVNNGHAVVVNYLSGDLRMSGRELPGEFRVAQFHWHWGQDDASGSEHTVNGHMYPMEMHVVTYNTKYGSLGEAVKHADGLAVLGIFIQTSSDGTDKEDEYEEIVKRLRDIQYPGNITSLPAMALASLLPADATQYFRYRGSLTTPPCSEVVTWTVLRNPVVISPAQLTAFRSLWSSEKDDLGKPRHLEGNWRPVQPQGRRKVKLNFLAVGHGSGSSEEEEED